MVPPPFKPVIKDDTDTSNFSEEFTRMLPVDSPAIIPKNADKIFKVCLRKNIIIFSIRIIMRIIFSIGTSPVSKSPKKQSVGMYFC